MNAKQEIKRELKARLKQLHGDGFAKPIAKKAGLSHQTVNKWFRTEVVNVDIENAAIEYLDELKAEAAAKLEKIKS